MTTAVQSPVDRRQQSLNLVLATVGLSLAPLSSGSSFDARSEVGS